jgi:arylsulfatase A-like enzyme
VDPWQDDGPARTVDLAPTLAAWLGIPAPHGLDGHPLPLR